MIKRFVISLSSNRVFVGVMAIPATVPPCVADSGMSPSPGGWLTRASKRRARARRVAVRHSIRTSLELKCDLYWSISAYASSDVEAASRDAVDFLPARNDEFEEVLKYFAPSVCVGDGSLACLKGTRKRLGQDTSVMNGAGMRKCIRDHCVPEALVEVFVWGHSLVFCLHMR